MFRNTSPRWQHTFKPSSYLRTNSCLLWLTSKKKFPTLFLFVLKKGNCKPFPKRDFIWHPPRFSPIPFVSYQSTQASLWDLLTTSSAEQTLSQFLHWNSFKTLEPLLKWSFRWRLCSTTVSFQTKHTASGEIFTRWLPVASWRLLGKECSISVKSFTVTVSGGWRKKLWIDH